MRQMPKNVDSWLAEFPVGELQRELDELRGEAAEIEGEIRRRQQLLEARNFYLGIAENSEGRIRAIGPSVPSAPARERVRNRLLRQEQSRVEQALVPLDRPPSRKPKDVAEIPTRISDSSARTGAKEDEPPLIDSAADSRSRAQKLIAFLESHQGETWKLSDIRDQLAREGVIEDAPEETHGLQVTASRLYRTGRLDRPQAGYYRLPFSKGAP